MRLHILMLTVVLLAPVGVGLAADNKASDKSARSSKPSGADEKFLREAAEGGQAEVELGKLAEQKASNDKIKEFARRMTEDHGKANQELMDIAKKENVSVPKELEGKQKSAYERLSKMSGDEFDREYMRLMIQDHQDTVKKFEQEAKSGKDSEVKEFANKQLPTLKKHLEMARSTGKMVGAEGKR